MKLRIALSAATGICLAFGLAACKNDQQMSTTELSENATAPATSPSEPASATERVADQGATAPTADPKSGTGYTHSICDAKALRRNEVCHPRSRPQS